MSQHVGTGDRTEVLWKSWWCLLALSCTSGLITSFLRLILCYVIFGMFGGDCVNIVIRCIREMKRSLSKPVGEFVIVRELSGCQCSLVKDLILTHSSVVRCCKDLILTHSSVVGCCSDLVCQCWPAGHKHLGSLFLETQGNFSSLPFRSSNK